jgi:flagellar FliL protein
MSKEIEEAEEEQPASSRKTGTLVIALTVGLIAGALGGSLVVGPLLADSSGEGDHGGAGDCAAVAGGHGSVAPAAVHTIDNVVINPAQSGGTRFLMVTVGVGLKDAHGAVTLALRDAELRDIVVRTLGSKTVEQLSDVASRTAIKEEMKTEVARLIGEKGVVDIYFPQFVIQ